MVRLWALEAEAEEDDWEKEEEAASGVDGLDFDDLSSFVFDDDDDEEDDDAAAASADERAATAAISAAVMGTRMRPLGSAGHNGQTQTIIRR